MSDHLPLLCTLKVNLTRATKQTQSRAVSSLVKWKKIDKTEYRNILTHQLSLVNGEAESLSSVDNEIQKLNEILVRSARSLSSSKSKQTKKPRLRFWTPEGLLGLETR